MPKKNEYDIRTVIAKKLKAWRVSKHLTQAELAQRLGVSQKVYASYEERRAKPSVRLFERIKTTTGIDLLVEINSCQTC